MLIRALMTSRQKTVQIVHHRKISLQPRHHLPLSALVIRKSDQVERTYDALPLSRADWAACRLPGGPVGPPARWAATSNVEMGHLN